MQLNPRRISTRSLLVIGLLFLVTVSGGTLAWFAQRLLDTVAETLVFVAELKHDKIEQMLSERRADAAVFSKNPAVISALAQTGARDSRSNSSAQLSGVIENLKAAYGYTTIEVIPASQLQPNLNVDTTYSPEIINGLTEAMRSRAPQIVDLHNAATGQVTLGVAHPVIDPGTPEQALLGVVYLEFDASRFLYQDLMKWPAPSETGETVLFRQDGQDILYLSPLSSHPNDAPMTIKAPRSTPNLLAAQILSNPERTILSGRDYAGREVLGAGLRVQGTNWWLAVKLDRSEIYKPANALGAGMAATATLATLFLIFLGRVIDRLRQERTGRLRAQLSEKYRQAIDSTLDAIVVFDRDGQMLEWNKSFVALIDRSESELVNITMSNLFADGDGPHGATLEEVTKARDRTRFRSRWRQKSGAFRDVDVSITPVAVLPGDDRIFVTARDITSEMRSRRRLELQNRLLNFINATNSALRNLRDVTQILDAACSAALSIGKFKLVWAGVPDKEGRVQPVAIYGEAASYVRSIVVTTDPTLPTSQGPVGRALNTGKSIVINDFQTNPNSTAWHEPARRFGLGSCAAIPVAVGGSFLAAIVFYTEESNFFDQEFLDLVERARQSITLACAAAYYGERAAVAASEATFFSDRYQAIFDSSPVALMIVNSDVKNTIRINKAFQTLFGYSQADISTQADWFEKMYPDPQFRQDIRLTWQHDLEETRRTGASISSPMLTLQRKDGSPRIVQGKVTVVGNDTIVAWTDFTETEEQARALRQGEARFRKLIEQTITGIYVVSDRKILFVNSRFEDITGYHSDELYGRDPRTLVTEDTMTVFSNARLAIEGGSDVVDFAVRMRRKDGELRDIQVHAAKSSWDGYPAIIALCQDISERKRAEERIANYLRQLKSSMQSTLNAVAKMVDFRDPYTAGHERRVGIIAAALGQKLGLSDEQCEWLNWAGLVHDIGKIAVPAELLSKPTRLTAIEYQMIKGHAESGYEILKDVEFPVPVAEIARQHHERLDGSGYPRGLKGDEILLEARIMAVADVVESMASHRPYRPGLGIQAALQEIVTHRGTHYDPAVVDALLQLINVDGWQLPR